MKKLFIICIALTALCGCAKPEDIENASMVSVGDIVIEGKQKYVDFNKGYVPDYLRDENGEYTAEEYNEYKNGIKSFYDTLPLSDVYLVQHNNGSEHNGRVNVRRDTVHDMLIAEDGDWYSLYNDNLYIPSGYEELIHGFNTADWLFCGALTGGAYDRLDFANEEYLLSAIPDKMFGLSFDNVEMFSDNLPLSLTIYKDGEGISKLYIKYADIEGQRKELSAHNTDMLKNAFSLADIKDGDRIIEILLRCIKTGNPENEDNVYFDIKTINPVNITDNITQSGIIVELK